MSVKWSMASGAMFLFGLWTFSSASAQDAKPKYVGSESCKLCHADEAKGAQYGHWKKSRHAKAFATLGTDQAKEIGKKLGIDDPQKSDKCRKCHVTEAGVEAALLGESFEKNAGVGCESCHGPGDDYSDVGVMKSREKSLKAGLILPSEKLCVTCHNAESPTYKTFDYKAFLTKISHPRPAKAK